MPLLHSSELEKRISELERWVGEHEKGLCRHKVVIDSMLSASGSAANNLKELREELKDLRRRIGRLEDKLKALGMTDNQPVGQPTSYLGGCPTALNCRFLKR